MSITIDGNNKDPYDILNKFDFQTIDVSYKEGGSYFTTFAMEKKDTCKAEVTFRQHKTHIKIITDYGDKHFIMFTHKHLCEVVKAIIDFKEKGLRVEIY